MKRNNPSPRRVSQLDTLGVASNEDVNSPLLPSPPYRARSSSSNLVEALHGQNIPAYRSRVDLMVDYREAESDENINDVGIERPGDYDDLRDAQPKPSVHYPAHVNETSVPGYFQHTPPKLESRASSVFGTDDEHENGEGDDYNWSAEEDLEDQQAEYEKHLGVKPKPQGWGIKRYSSTIICTIRGINHQIILPLESRLSFSLRSSVRHSSRQCW